MRTYEEIIEELHVATGSDDAESLERIAAELDRFDTPMAEAARSKARAQVHQMRGDLHESLRLYHVALDAYTAAGSKAGVALTRQSIGTVYKRTGELPSAMIALRQAMEIFEEIEDILGIAETHADLGSLYLAIGDYPQALEHLQRSSDIYDSLGDRSKSIFLFNNIAILYAETGDHDRALANLQRAVALHTEQGNRVKAAHATGNMAGVYAQIGDHVRAVECARRALATMEEVGQLPEIYTQLLILCTILTKAGDHEEAMHFKERLDSMVTNDPLRRIGGMSISGELAEYAGDLEKAREIYHEALVVAQECGFRAQEAMLHKALRDLAQKRMDFEAYIYHNEQYQQINEETRGKEATQKMAMMEADRKMQEERQERDKERAVLYSTLPQHIADRVIRGEVVEDHFENATVMFADIAGFTSNTSAMNPRDVIRFLEEIYTAFDAICKRHNVVKVKTIGDSYLAFASDQAEVSSQEQIANAALEMMQCEFYWPRGDFQGDSRERLTFRIGIDTGPVSAGVIGNERLQYDIWGDTVNVASRMESTGEPGRIHVSQTFASLLSPGPFLANARNDIPHLRERGDSSQLPIPWSLRERGAIEIKGKGPMTTYWLEEE